MGWVRGLAKGCAALACVGCADLIEGAGGGGESTTGPDAGTTTGPGTTAPMVTTATTAATTGSGSTSSQATLTDATGTDTTGAMSSSSAPPDTMSDTTQGEESTSPATTDDPSTSSSSSTTDEPLICVNVDQEPDTGVAPAESMVMQTCNGADGVAFDGSLQPGDLVDRYTFDAPWTFIACGAPNPGLQVSVPGTEVCATFSCGTGSEDPTCYQGTENPEGNGCCGPDMVDLDINCSITGNESTTVLLTIFTQAPDGCVEYDGTANIL